MYIVMTTLIVYFLTVMNCASSLNDCQKPVILSYVLGVATPPRCSIQNECGFIVIYQLSTSTVHNYLYHGSDYYYYYYY